MVTVPFASSQVMDLCINALEQGGLVISPSDTVYGALVDATNQSAVEKLIAFKNRPLGKPISIFVADMDMATQYVHISQKQQDTLTTMLPGPFTTILPSRGSVISLLESEQHTLGIRIPHFPFILNLVRRYAKPVTATSANMAGRSPHYSITSLLKSLPRYKKDLIDLVVDAGTLPKNKPSTVIDLTGDSYEILRKGDVGFQLSGHKYISKSLDETNNLARTLVDDHIQKGKSLIFLLHGNLGSGKTAFTKGLAQLFGISSIVSPTFVIYYEYPLEQDANAYEMMYHFDLYNIQKEEEYETLQILNTFTQHNVVIAIEWAEKLPQKYRDLLNNHGVVVDLYFTHIDETTRQITHCTSKSSA